MKRVFEISASNGNGAVLITGTFEGNNNLTRSEIDRLIHGLASGVMHAIAGGNVPFFTQPVSRQKIKIR